MRKALLLAVFASMFACTSRAQLLSASFTFGGLPSPFTSQQRCANITSWTPSGPFLPDSGEICLALYPAVYTSIEIPFQLGFPNNGYLQGCEPTVWGPLVWQNGGSQNVAGSTAIQTFVASGCYDGGNTTVTATVKYVVVSFRSCGRTGCRTFYGNQVTGGSGTVTD